MDHATRKLYREKFRDIAPALAPEDAAIEANRCLNCYDAPCMKACPTHIDVPRFIRQIATGNLLGSAKTILEANPFGHSCARACPVEVLCEGACVYKDWQERPIDIGRLQRRATDVIHEDGVEPFRPGQDNGRKVAVIGAGPAGLSCASYLRRLGYAVTVFEKSKLPGGLNTFGIAEYKMPQSVSLDEVRRILRLGVEIRLGKEAGKDISAQKLLDGFDAVFLGCGLGKTRRLDVPGENLKGVWDALSFIRFVKERNLGPIAKSRVTIVVGAGNTAIDAATQAKRTGTPRVIMAYRRAQSEMGAYSFEFDLAKKDGVEFLWNASPARISGRGSVQAVEFVKTRAKGERLMTLPRSRFKISCDRVIKAIGQEKQSDLADALGVKLSPEGKVAVDAKTLASSNPKVFAGGDAVNGGKEVVNAAADGKRAAWAIHQSLHPGAEPTPENEYWVSTIQGRQIAPVPRRLTHA